MTRVYIPNIDVKTLEKQYKWLLSLKPELEQEKL